MKRPSAVQALCAQRSTLFAIGLRAGHHEQCMARGNGDYICSGGNAIYVQSLKRKGPLPMSASILAEVEPASGIATESRSSCQQNAFSVQEVDWSR